MPRVGSKGNRNYVFTVNNPNGQLLPELWPQDKVKYVIWSLEQGSLDLEVEGGQLHFQGYIELQAQVSIRQLKQWDGFETAHFEPRRGTQAQAIAYCSKTTDPTFLEGPWEYGKRNTQGNRADLQHLQHDIDYGYSLSYIAKNHFSNFIRYNKGITEYYRVTKPKVESKDFSINDFNRPALNLSKAVVLLGPTKMGKTEFALAHFAAPLLVRHIDSLRDLQPGEHDGIVFDDMKFSHFPVGARIAILDIAHTSEIHCRYSNGIIPSKFRRIFTTNNPDIFFNPSDTTDEREAINRRVEFIHVDTPLFGVNTDATLAADQGPPPPTAPPVATYADYVARSNTEILALYKDYGSSPSPPPLTNLFCDE